MTVQRTYAVLDKVESFLRTILLIARQRAVETLKGTTWKAQRQVRSTLAVTQDDESSQSRRTSNRVQLMTVINVLDDRERNELSLVVDSITVNRKSPATVLFDSRNAVDRHD